MDTSSTRLPSSCEEGQRADHEPLYFLVFPGVAEVGQGGPEAEGASPSGPLTGPVFGMVNTGLPRRVSCLTAAQAGHEAQSRDETCALTYSGCLIACLTAQTAARGATAGQTRALHGQRGQGSTPATALVTGHYPVGLPG